MGRHPVRTVALGFALAGLLGLVGAPVAIASDDYPSELKAVPRDSVRDPWGHNNRECTSFVAWRLNQRGFPVRTRMPAADGQLVDFYYARDWATAATRIGLVVDDTPTVGSVAQWGASRPGDDGHVAWVTGVAADFSVSIEEYNYGLTGLYAQREGIRAQHYIHIDPSWKANGGHSLARVAGSDRMATAAATSRRRHPGAGTASAVVLARADSPADALAGTPLALAKGAPVLLTSAAGLDPTTEAEVRRVLAPGGTVYLLGGTAALGVAVQQRVQALGFGVVRFAGANRYATAVDIATRGLDGAGTVLLADGRTFVSALLAGPAAARLGGATVLLTDGRTLPPETAAYLAAHPGRRYAIGDDAAAAAPKAVAVRGGSPAALSVAVANAFFDAPAEVGIAGFDGFADALSGGASGAPLLLTDQAELSPEVDAFVRARRDALREVLVYGGISAVGSDTLFALHQALGVGPPADLVAWLGL